MRLYALDGLNTFRYVRESAEPAEKVVFVENLPDRAAGPEGDFRKMYVAHVLDGRVLVTDAECLNDFLAARR